MNFHFTPPKGWMNDPNGLIYINRLYHIFYQYYPDDVVWGPMHWGHCVSRDFKTFENYPIALYPEGNDYIFSGSCIYDTDNVSGLGTEDTPALLAIYTSHNKVTGEQEQCIAYSHDFKEFHKLKTNPVISNKIGDANYQKEFRDPKVFKNHIKGGYSMLLAVDHEIQIYHSADLLTWSKTGSFNPGEYGYSGLCECPDLIPFETDGKTLWMLSISMVCDDGLLENPRIMQYFVGSFDGDKYTVLESQKKPFLLDYGPDNYAAVSFSNCDETLIMGWGENWEYISDIPCKNTKGKMTIPRTLTLRKTNLGYRLFQQPVFVPDSATKATLKAGEKLRTDSGKDKFITISATDDTITVDRLNATDTSINMYLEKTCFNVFTAPRSKQGDCDITIIKDENYFEIFADSGEIVFSISAL